MYKMTSILGFSPASSKALSSISRMKMQSIDLYKGRLLIDKLSNPNSIVNTPLTLSCFSTPINNKTRKINLSSKDHSENTSIVINNYDYSRNKNEGFYSNDFSQLTSEYDKGPLKDNKCNNKVISLLEHKKCQLKANAEKITAQLKRYIRQIEYIDTKIKELKGECIAAGTDNEYIKNNEIDFFNSICDLTTLQTNDTIFSRMSTTTTTNTFINSPKNNELPSNNDFFGKNTLNEFQTPRKNHENFNIIIDENIVDINDSEWVLIPEFKDLFLNTHFIPKLERP